MSKTSKPEKQKKGSNINNSLDPQANHDYKAIRVPFNEYEYRILQNAAEKSGRTKLNYIRWAILRQASEIDA